VSEGRGSGCNTGVSAHAAVHHVIASHNSARVDVE
jgi:hypothetical protein